jgi:hypothetical protein
LGTRAEKLHTFKDCFSASRKRCSPSLHLFVPLWKFQTALATLVIRKALFSVRMSVHDKTASPPRPDIVFVRTLPPPFLSRPIVHVLHHVYRPGPGSLGHGRSSKQHVVSSTALFGARPAFIVVAPRTKAGSTLPPMTNVYAWKGTRPWHSVCGDRAHDYARGGVPSPKKVAQDTRRNARPHRAEATHSPCVCACMMGR